MKNADLMERRLQNEIADISELLPAQALIDYDQAKDVLEKVCQSQADLTRKEMAEEVERLVRELERCLGRGIDSSFLRTFTIVQKAD